jgi:transposase-like protein
MEKSKTSNRYSPEVRARAVRMVLEHQSSYETQAAALVRAVSSNEIVLLRTINYVRQDIFNSVEEFIERIVAVDPSRKEAVMLNRSTIVEAVLKTARNRPDGQLIFEQPIKANIFTPIKT